MKLPEGPLFLRRIVSLSRKEFRQLMRDQLTMGFVVGVPIVQMVLS